MADDLAELREVIRRYLEHAGRCAVVGESGNGAEALERIASLRPDVAILDVNMPGMNGIDLARALQAQSDSPRIVFCSSDPPPDGPLPPIAVAWLRKPFRLSELSRCVARAADLRPISNNLR